MNKIWNMILGWCMLSLLLTGCQKDVSSVSLTAEIESYNGGKVYLDSEHYSCWEYGDRVKINQSGYDVLVNNNEAQINDVAYQESGYVAAYPECMVEEITNEHVLLNIPNTQQYTQTGVVQHLNNPMVAMTNSGNGNLMFRNMGALIGVKLENGFTGAIVIDKIQLEALGEGANLCGKAKVTKGSDGMLKMEIIGEGKNNVVLTDVNATLENRENAIFYIGVPPVSVEGNKFKVRVLFHSGETAYQFYGTTKSTVGNIARNQFGVLPVSLSNENVNVHTINSNGLLGAGTQVDPYIMSSKKDLDKLRTLNLTGTNPIYIEQMGDIVFPTNGSWEGLGTSNKPFKGVYDGKGYKIKFDNTKCSGLFNVVGANSEIKNVVIEGTINAKDYPVSGGVVSLVSGENVKIENCINKAEINSLDNSINVSMGGICGKVKNSSNAKIENCKNIGQLKCSSNSSFIYLGGICGQVSLESDVDIIICTNRGNISMPNGNSYNIGGILGGSNWNILLDSCVNYGNIEAKKIDITSKPYSYHTMGGLVGLVDHDKTLEIKNCANHGMLKNANSAGGLVGYVGSLTLVNSYAIASFDNCKFVGGLVYNYNFNNNAAYKLEMKNCYVDILSVNNVSSIKWIIKSLENQQGCVYNIENVFYPNDSYTIGIDDNHITMHVIDHTLKDVLNTWVDNHANQGYSQWDLSVDNKPKLKFE